MRVSILRIGIVFLVVLSIALAVGTTTALAHKSKENYKVLISGDVRTVDSEGLEANFITTGNRSGTKIGGDAAPTLLDLNIGISTHPSFGVCNSPVDQPVDDVEWNLGGINIGKDDKLVARFNRYGVPENENKDRCGFDDYTLRIVFEFDVVEYGDGSRVYTPTPIGSARVVIIHYAETGKGKNRESHHEPTKGEALELGLGVTDASITITITPQ